MIVIKLNGGLGNQLFQYAAAKALAIKHNTELVLDIRNLYPQPRERNFDLKLFNIKCKYGKLGYVPNPFQLYLHAKSYIFRAIKLKITKTEYPRINTKKLTVYENNAPNFFPEFFSCANNTYLMGFFQNEDFFIKHKDILFKELTPKKLAPHTIQLINSIKEKSCSVSIHIRRTDFLEQNGYYIILDSYYYQHACKIIENKYSDITYYVFSDDIEFSKSLFKNNEKNNYVFCDSKTYSSVDTLWAMTFCHHNIIANSTFSWWGAWLNKNKEKIVISPDYWMRDIQAENKVPKNWLIVPHK